MEKDWSGNKVSYVTTNGFANNRDYEREENDYYATEPKAVEMLLNLEDFSDRIIWECACGEGHLSKAMLNKKMNVYSSDLINRGFGDMFDFLSDKNEFWDGHIITNPPYKYASEFIVKSMNIMQTGCMLALFLPIRYTEGKSRKKLFELYPPKTIYVSSSRLKCAINGNFNAMKGSATSYAWFVWKKGYVGITELKWFN